jgi:hypothetical protein
MSLYDRVRASMEREFGPLSSPEQKSRVAPTKGPDMASVGNVEAIPKGGDSPIVPNVTCARENDRSIFPPFSSNTGRLLTVIPSRAQVTFGTVSPCHKLASASASHSEWDESALELIAWFRTAPRLEVSFNLAPHMTIIDPAKFYAALERDIAAGPSGARARYGAVMSDLKLLRALS